MIRGAAIGVIVFGVIAITGCKDSRDGALGAAAPPSLPTISVPPDVDGLRIKPPASDEVTLTKIAGTWQITAPSSGGADQSKVQSVVDNLVGLKVTESVGTGADPATYNLDPTHLVHVVALKGGQQVADISFGKSTGRGSAAHIGADPAVYFLSGYSSYLYGAAERYGATAASQQAEAARALTQKQNAAPCHDRCQSLWAQCSAAAVLAGNDLAADKCNQTLSQCHNECDTGRGLR